MTAEEKKYQDLLIALVRMEKNQEAGVEAQKLTTDNMNKLVITVETLVPVHKDIHYLRKLLYVSIAIFGAYLLWSSREIYGIKDEFHSHEKTQAIQYDGMKSRVTKIENYQNRNFGFLKGRINNANK